MTTIHLLSWRNLFARSRFQYKLKHSGARHKGVFSRLEYQSRQSISGESSFKNLLVWLPPPRVHSVYYRDEIDNISSSSICVVIHTSAHSPLAMVCHCNLFQADDGRRYANLTFGCPLLDTVIHDRTIEVVIPEGSKSPEAVVPFLTEQHLETSYSYLDVVGRTTVVIRRRMS